MDNDTWDTFVSKANRRRYMSSALGGLVWPRASDRSHEVNNDNNDDDDANNNLGRF